MRQKVFAISILNYNSYEDTVHLVDTLSADRCDIFILDNASQHDEWRRLEDWYAQTDHIFVHTNRINRGFAGGNNDNLTSIQLTGVYTYLLLLNPDVTTDVWFLERFGTQIQSYHKDHPSTILYGPAIRTSYGGKTTLQYGAGRNKRIHQGYPLLQKTAKPSFIYGCCLAIAMQHIPDPLFDENYFLYNEEVDLCYRLTAAGYQMHIYPDVAITHQQDYLQKREPYFLYARNRSRLLFAKKRAQRYQRPTIFLRSLVLVVYFSIVTWGTWTRHVIHGIFHGMRKQFDDHYFTSTS